MPAGLSVSVGNLAAVLMAVVMNDVANKCLALLCLHTWLALSACDAQFSTVPVIQLNK